MTKVRDNVRLHHKTVSEHQNHIVRKSGQRKVKAAVSSMQVDLRVWRRAMELAGGDSTRIVKEAPDSVLVVNHSKRKS